MSLSTLTVNGTDYVSYASVAEADSHLAVDPVRSAAWAALTPEAKMVNLVAATNRLDLLNWAGRRTGGATQANAWPRKGLQYEGGEAVGESDIPRDIERAAALLAGTIAATPAAAEAGTSGSSVERVRAGSVEVEYSVDRRRREGRPVRDETVWALVARWVSGSSLAAPSAYGTDETAGLVRDQFKRSEGVS